MQIRKLKEFTQKKGHYHKEVVSIDHLVISNKLTSSQLQNSLFGHSKSERKSILVKLF
ncbi:hypothetical protein Syun_025144 [Stephania yunnanensis]|uniref:Uncharacterized protein n=1 Tax=Stephania yunnanensis TaxID=152371 RepID=A0AAP0HUL9_9MAGN